MQIQSKEKLIQTALCVCASLSVATTLGVAVILFYEAAGFFEEISLKDFLLDPRWSPLFTNKHFGVLPLVAGTLVTSAIALVVALPFGLIIAVYLSEFANPKARRLLKPVLEILAGIPTVVYGYFALVVVTPFIKLFLPDLSSFNALSAGIVMGIMILPTVATLGEDALYVIPVSLREGAYALGATKLQMIWRALVPASMGGILAAFIMGISRAVGETMIVAIAAGNSPKFSLNPLESVQTMTAYIVQVSLGDTPRGTIEYKTIFAVGLSLFLITLLLNFISFWIRDRFERKFP